MEEKVVVSTRLDVKKLATVALFYQREGIVFTSKSDLMRKILNHYHKILSKLSNDEFSDLDYETAKRILLMREFKESDFDSPTVDQKKAFVETKELHHSQRAEELKDFIDEVDDKGIPKHLKEGGEE